MWLRVQMSVCCEVLRGRHEMGGESLRKMPRIVFHGDLSLTLHDSHADLSDLLIARLFALQAEGTLQHTISKC